MGHKAAQVELKVNECKPLRRGGAGGVPAVQPQRVAHRRGQGVGRRRGRHRLGVPAREPQLLRAQPQADGDRARGRRLHSSTFRLNVSAFDGIGGAFRGCLGGV